MSIPNYKTYKHGSVYKIFSDKTDKIYIGSTTKLLNSRLSSHLHYYNSYINHTHNHYLSYFDIIKLGGNIQIELLEFTLYNTHNKLELLTLESQYIKLFSKLKLYITHIFLITFLIPIITP